MNGINILQKLMNKSDLDEEESRYLMANIVTKGFSDALLGAILVALENKGISCVELSVFVDVLKSYSIKIKPNVDLLMDVCGTGADKSNTFNISTITSFVLAAGGVPVAKHGNKAVSSNCGSADILENLGVNILLSPDQVKQCMEKVGIGFLFAPTFHPAFKGVAPIRKQLGVRTVFNILGPLLNPAPITSQVIGVFDDSIMRLYAQVLIKQGVKNAMVVHGNGIDEITLCGETKIIHIDNENDNENCEKLHEYMIKPEDFGLIRCKLSDIQAYSIQDNIDIFNSIINNNNDLIQITANKNSEYSHHKNIVLLNAAAGFLVSKKVVSFDDGIKLASKLISKGKVSEKFNEFRRLTNALARNNKE